MIDPLRFYFMYVIVPLWLLAGVGDWICHRKEHIERNAGPFESLLHLLMLAEIGLPILIALFFEINATVIALMLALLVVHEITAWWDVSYASKHRKISTVEQHMHSLLEILPLTALSLVLIVYWEQTTALFGFGHEPALHGIHWKTNPLPLWYQALLITAMAIFGVLPYVEEMLRCLRWRRENASQ